MTWEYALRYLSGAELSRITGVLESTISRGRKSGGELKARHVVAIARHLGLTTDEFLTGRANESLQQAREIIGRMYESVRSAEHVGREYLDRVRSSGSLSVEVPYYSGPDDSHSVRESAPRYGSLADDGEQIMVMGMTAAGSPIEMGQGEGMVSVDRCLLCGNPQEHYAVRVHGTSMTGAGIQDGDYCLIYSASVPLHGQIMLARHGDQLTLKLLKEDLDRTQGRRYHLYYVDGSGREVLADEDGEDWYIIGNSCVRSCRDSRGRAVTPGKSALKSGSSTSTGPIRAPARGATRRRPVYPAAPGPAAVPAVASDHVARRHAGHGRPIPLGVAGSYNRVAAVSYLDLVRGNLHLGNDTPAH